MYEARQQALQAELARRELDGVALMPGPNMVYLTGIHSHVSERPVLLFIMRGEGPAMLIPELEAMKARAAGLPEGSIFAWDDVAGFEPAFAQASERLALAGKRMAVEALHMRLLELELLQKHAPNMGFVHAEPLLATLRMVKDAAEITAMAKAVSVAEKAMTALLPEIKIGMTEKEVAARLNLHLMEAGADTVAFSPIVSAGPNSASPHAMPSQRPLAAGDMLVMDWGAYVDDYPSDITRTFAVGHIEPEFERIYDAVRRANARGKQVTRPGATGQDVDRAARQVIEEAGYGQQFLHRTGHGLGLEVHEPPYAAEGQTEPLQEGNVFTVEPGIYLAGRGGVRIEDDVLVTAGGYRSLTSFSRDLMIVGN